MLKPRVLIVTTDTLLLSDLREHLMTDFHVDEAQDGPTCLRQLTEQPPDLIFSDERLPKLHGWTTVRRIRLAAKIPVVLLVASAGDRVRALKLGADDAMSKPVNGVEAAARAGAILRRYGFETAPSRTAAPGPLTFDPVFRTVTFHGQAIPLSDLEFSILAMLAAHPRQAVPRKVLGDQIWGRNTVRNHRIIDTHIKRLRRKLGDHSGTLIANVWGIGYRFTLDSCEACTDEKSGG